MDPLSELQDDLTLDDTSQALNQLKLASIDEKNWPSDEMPDFPKSGGQHGVPGSCDTTEGRPLPAGGDSRGKVGARSPVLGYGQGQKPHRGQVKEGESLGECWASQVGDSAFGIFLR